MQRHPDTTAAAGAYVAVPKGTGNALNLANARGSVRHTFQVPVTDTYLLWGRVHAANGAQNSFFVRLDSGPAFLWDTQQGSTWLWDQVNHRGTAREGEGAAVEVVLTAGTHTLEVLHREAGTKLDRLLITNNPAFVPTGLGEQVALDRDGGG